MKTIIYIEDDEDTAEAVKTVLERAGYRVEIASCGLEGVRMIKTAKYDLALLDIMLPDISGWEVCTAIGSAGPKIAMLSSLPPIDKTATEMRLMGVEDYILKPFSRTDLINRVGKMLKGDSR